MALHGRVHLAVAVRGKLRSGHAEHEQVIVGGAGAALAKGQVIFIGAAFVAMAFNLYVDARELFQYVGFLAQVVTGRGVRGGIILKMLD